MPGKYSADISPWTSSASRRTMLAGLGAAGLSSVSASAPKDGGALTTSVAPISSATGEVSVAQWGVRGGNDPRDTERIQRALEEAPIGCDLIFPTGYYRINHQLNVRRKLNLISRGAIMSGDLSPDEDLFSINIEDEGNRDNRIMLISGFRIWMNKGGRNCIGVYSRPPNTANMGIVIENNVIGVLPESRGYAISLEGIGTHFNIVRNCQIENGVFLGCADGTTIENCVVFGKKTAITLDLVSGAFQTHIVNNGLVARDGALLLLNGSQVVFSGNQVEQFAADGINQSKTNASVSIVASNRGVRQVRIIGNNFGGGTNVDSSISISGDCQDVYVDKNVFATTGSGRDIILEGSAVSWSRIGPNNSVRGPARGKRSANMTRPVVQDTGHGTFGVRKASNSFLRLGDGWIPKDGLSFWKDLSGVVRLEGAWQSGLTAPGTLIATLPDGFRPAGPGFLHCGTSVVGEIAVLRVDADGVIRVHRTPSGIIYLNGTSFSAADRAPYPSSDP